MLGSLALINSSAAKSKSEAGENSDDEDAMFNRAIDQLLWVATPEVVCKIVNGKRPAGGGGGGVGGGGESAQVMQLKSKYRLDLQKHYFEKQSHCNLEVTTVTVQPVQDFSDSSYTHSHIFTHTH
jgi:hypothetical protein